MIAQHMRYTASAVVPTGDFLAHVGDWTGLPPAELLSLMRGTSPISYGWGMAHIRINNRAFAELPDQGGWGLEEVQLREAGLPVPWFQTAPVTVEPDALAGVPAEQRAWKSVKTDDQAIDFQC